MQGVKRIMPDEFWVDLALIYPTRGGGKKLTEKYKEYGADPGFVCRMAKERGIQAERSTRLAFYRESLKNGHFEAMVRELSPQIGGNKRLSEMFGIPITMINTASNNIGVHAPATVLHKYHEENLRTDYFDTLDAERAYWLGYIIADGCVVEYKRNGQPSILALGCKTSDEDHILRLRNEIRSQHAITRGFKKDKLGNILVDKNGIPIGKTSVFITSPIIAKTLVEVYGILPRKTWGDPPFPDWLTPELTPHFSRGLFDGDGCCYSGVNKYGRILYNFHYLGSKSLIRGLLYRIINSLDVYPVKVRQHYNMVYQIAWSSLKDIEALYYWMYPTPDLVCLPRKRIYLERMLSGVFVSETEDEPKDDFEELD